MSHFPQTTRTHTPLEKVRQLTALRTGIQCRRSSSRVVAVVAYVLGARQGQCKHNRSCCYCTGWTFWACWRQQNIHDILLSWLIYKCHIHIYIYMYIYVCRVLWYISVIYIYIYIYTFVVSCGIYDKDVLWSLFFTWWSLSNGPLLLVSLWCAGVSCLALVC